MLKYVLLTALVAGSSAFAKSETFTISHSCTDRTMFCAEVVGTHSKGTARINNRKYSATNKSGEATCCQLARQIRVDACKEGNESKNAVVTCN